MRVSLGVLAGVAAAWAAGCYHVGIVPQEGVSRVYVPFFRNETFPYERGLEYDLTAAVRRGLEEQTALVPVGSEAEADAVLEGVVKSFRSNIRAEDRLGAAVRSSANVEIHVVLRRAGIDGETLVSMPLHEHVTFHTASGLGDAKDEVVRRVADRILAMAFTSWDH